MVKMVVFTVASTAPCRLPRKKGGGSIEELEEYVESSRRDMDRLELRRAILEGTMELLGKDRSVDSGMLTNGEKTILVEGLRSAHRLGALLDAAGMAKSGYPYQKNALLRPGRHAARPAHPRNGGVPRQRWALRVPQGARRP